MDKIDDFLSYCDQLYQGDAELLLLDSYLMELFHSDPITGAEQN